MSDVSSVASWQCALTQAQIESGVSLRMVKLTQQLDQQQAALVGNMLDSIAETTATHAGRIDTYA
jgi:hypothetical protein